MSVERAARLAVIATAAGAFSALFGVGGGTIIVPLLVLWMGYGHREATGTSLAAIAVIGALAAGAHALYGNVELAKGLLVAAPAIAGVLAGTAIQQRTSERAVAAAFAHLSQLHALATSLVAIVPVAIVGAARQREYGNVRPRDGLVIGLLAPL